MNQFTTSIWGDEGFSAILSMKSIPQILKIIATDTSPPLWNITEHIAFQIFGVSEIVIRALAFSYFLLAVFFIYKIGETLWGKRTAILAAALTFLNPFFFIYAFEGRMYSILALGITASMYYFLKIVRSKNIKKHYFFGYIIATLWAMYSHHFAIFAVFVQGMWFLYEYLFGSRKNAVSVFKALIAIGILYLPWIMPLYNQTKMVGGGFWLGTPDFEDLGFLIAEYLAVGIRNEGLKIPIVNIVLYQAAFLMVAATLIVRNWKKNIKETIFLLLWFLGPILLTWLISQKFQSIFFNRYLLYTIPAGMLIVASNVKKRSAILIVILLLLFSRIDYFYFTHPVKLPFKEISRYVKETRGENDFLINWNSSSHHLWETKFYGIGAPIYIPSGGELPFFVGTALMEESDVIHQLPDNIDRVGVITSGPIEEIELPGYTEMEGKTIKNLKFIWYQKE